jgi:hypothetical protein
MEGFMSLVLRSSEGRESAGSQRMDSSKRSPSPGERARAMRENQEGCENHPVGQRTEGVGLDEPEVVRHARYSAHVYQAMQELPPPATQAPDHGRGGGGRQGNEQDECGEARGDVRLRTLESR